MTEDEAWDELRECAIASNTDPRVIIAHAKAIGIGPRALIDRYYMATDIRVNFPKLHSFPFGNFAATPPGFIDIRMLFQREKPIWWLDILRTPYPLDDTELFTDALLDGALAYLKGNADRLLDAARAAALVDGEQGNPAEWIERTPLWRELVQEADRRAEGPGRSPIVAMRAPEE